jgi:hypothetical protein
MFVAAMIIASAAFAQTPPAEPHRNLIKPQPPTQQSILSSSETQNGGQADRQTSPMNSPEPNAQVSNKLNHALDDIKITDAVVAAFTVFLVIGTFLLWDATRRLWRAGEKQLAEFHTSVIDNRESAARQAADMERSIKAAEETATAAARSAQIARETLDKDLDRRKKQSTVEYWTTTRSMYYRNYPSLREIRNPSNDQSFKNSDKGELLREYLGMLEVYSIGIETGLFDFDTAKALSGGFIRRQLARYSHYITAENQRTEGRAYSSLLNLEKKLA